MTLTEYLHRHKISIRTFAKDAGLAWRTIRRAKLGENISLSTALAIVQASKGQICLDDLLKEGL